MTWLDLSIIPSAEIAKDERAVLKRRRGGRGERGLTDADFYQRRL
jgi:hypothetical protein